MASPIIPEGSLDRDEDTQRPTVPPCPRCGRTNWAVVYELTLGVGITEGGIVDVVVEDENLGPIKLVQCRDCDFTLCDEEARAHPAARLAENDHDWPRWRFGW